MADSFSFEIDVQAFRTLVHHAKDIKKDPSLAANLTSFINLGYKYVNPDAADRWDTFDRLQTPTEVYETIGQDGLIGTTYYGEMPVACAAAAAWKGDSEGFAEEGEVEKGGWEIKMVTTRVGWMKRGLVGRCLDAMVVDLARIERERATFNGSTNPSQNKNMKLRLWAHAVEDMNGEYWRRRGWKELRRYEKPKGHWVSREGYLLLVMLKEVDVVEHEF